VKNIVEALSFNEGLDPIFSTFILNYELEGLTTSKSRVEDDFAGVPFFQMNPDLKGRY